jgi:hypothetical protein
MREVSRAGADAGEGTTYAEAIAGATGGSATAPQAPARAENRSGAPPLVRRGPWVRPRRYPLEELIEISREIDVSRGR